VAEQERTKEALARGKKLIDDRCAPVAVFFQPRHRRARRCRERGLACGKESGQQQADNNNAERDPVFLRHSPASLPDKNSRMSAGSTSAAIKLLPMPRTRMNVSAPRLTFLSCAIRSIR